MFYSYHQQLYLLEKDFDQLQYQKNENENEKIRLQSSLNEIEIEMKQKNREISFLTNQLNMLKQQQMVGGINGISNGKYNNLYIFIFSSFLLFLLFFYFFFSLFLLFFFFSSSFFLHSYLFLFYNLVILVQIQ